MSRTPADRPPGDPPAGRPAPDEHQLHDRFLLDAVLAYDGTDDPGRRASALALLAEHPELARSSSWAAAAAQDHRALAGLLAADPSSARSIGGPRGWPPLLYLTYSRLSTGSAAADGAVQDSERCLRLLLEAGADPDAGYLPPDGPTPFTALTGLFGGGEEGNTAQPPHPCQHRLATLLLQAGADANDAQALYNRMFGPADDHLELLFEYRLGAGDGGPWRRRDPDHTDTPAQLLRGQLSWAVTHGYADRIALLARHGVDLDSPLDAGSLPMGTSLTPLQLAAVSGQRSSADRLRELGAVDQHEPAIELVDALLETDADRVRVLEARHPGLLAKVRRAHPALILRAVVIGRPAAIELLLSWGFDVDALGRADIPRDQPWETALHHAAGEGLVDIARLLLRSGADAQVRDHRFGATPVEWARFFDHPTLVTLLDEYSRT